MCEQPHGLLVAVLRYDKDPDPQDEDQCSTGNEKLGLM